MDTFVTLDTKRPVGIGRYGAQSLVSFYGENQTAIAQRIVPNAVNNFNFWRVYTSYQITGFIFAISQHHDKFITNRQYRGDSLHNGVIIFYSIPDKSKTGYLH